MNTVDNRVKCQKQIPKHTNKLNDKMRYMLHDVGFTNQNKKHNILKNGNQNKDTVSLLKIGLTELDVENQIRDHR